MSGMEVFCFLTEAAVKKGCRSRLIAVVTRNEKQVSTHTVQVKKMS